MSHNLSRFKHIAFTLWTIALLFYSSCKNRVINQPIKEVCIDSFFISIPNTPNPTCGVFVIKTDDSLSKVLASKNWESYTIKGGFFDTQDYEDFGLHSVEYTYEDPNTFYIAVLSKFWKFTHQQLDSIGSTTFPLVEITFKANKRVWILKKCN